MWKQNQSKLDNWIDIKLIPKVTPTMFYIDWNWDRSYPVSHAIMLKESADISRNYSTFQKYINWKDFKSRLLVCGNFPKEQLSTPYKFYGHPSDAEKTIDSRLAAQPIFPSASLLQYIWLFCRYSLTSMTSRPPSILLGNGPLNMPFDMQSSHKQLHDFC